MSEVTSGRFSSPRHLLSLFVIFLFIILPSILSFAMSFFLSRARTPPNPLYSPYIDLSFWNFLSLSLFICLSRLLRPRRAFFAIPLLHFASTSSLSGSHYLLITSYLVTCYPFAWRSILFTGFNRVHASVLTRTF